MAVMLVMATAGPLAAQEWTWPERAENLTELPEDFPPQRLSAVMRGPDLIGGTAAFGEAVVFAVLAGGGAALWVARTQRVPASTE